jgi:Putative zinc-finger
MNHQQATESMATERYLLDELTPEARDAFEEHFFDCQECATDLRAGAGFVDAATRQLGAGPKAITPASDKPRRSLFRPAFAWGALAASLLVTAYQNVVIYPHYKTEIAELRAPEILPSLSLVGGNSRGGAIPAVAVVPQRPFLLLLDIPTQDRFSNYTCLLYSPSGSLVWRVEVSAQSAKDTVPIRVPATDPQSGEYNLLVQGNGPEQGTAAVDLGRFPFTLTSIR